MDEYPRYAVVLADTQVARMFVVASNSIEHEQQIEGTRTRRHKTGGWSQARFQRHVDNYHAQHAREIVEALAQIVRQENIGSVVVAGDQVIVPLLKQHFPKDIAERLVDVIKLDVRTSEREVIEATIAAMREKDVASDRDAVDALIGAYRANGLAVVGVDATRNAFEIGQVDELLIAARPAVIDVSSGADASADSTSSPNEQVANELVARAHQTSARIRFIQDASLLVPAGGVGAFLRFKL
jgi:peptide subunit release factor 1 (eRF1)